MDQFESEAPSPGTDGDPSQKPQSRLQARFDELTRARHEALRALEATRDENAQLRAQLESIGSKVDALASNQASQGKVREWPDLSEQEIFAHIQDNGLTDPAVLARAVKELARREAQATVQATEKKLTAQQQQNLAVQKAWQRAMAEYGPDVLKEDSALRRAAEEVANSLQSEFGRKGANIFEENPVLVYLTFAAAQGKLGASKAGQAQTEAAQLREEAKARAAGEVSVAGASEASAAMKSLLAKNDWRGALRQLDTVRAFRGEPPKGVNAGV